LVVLGLGLGYHVLEMARCYPETTILVIECRREIYALAACYGVLSHLPENVRHLVGVSPDEVVRQIQEIQRKNDVTSVVLYPLPGAMAAYGDYYGVIRDSLSGRRVSGIEKRLHYSKFLSESLNILIVDFGYFLTREVERALQNSGHKVTTLKGIQGMAPKSFLETLIEGILEFRPDLILTINHFGFDEKGVIAEFLRSIEMPVASWFVDSPNVILRAHGRNVSPYVSLFLWDRSYIPEMKAMGFEDVSFLPLATDPSIFKPRNLSAEQRARFHADVGFVGNSMVDWSREKLRDLSVSLQGLAKRLAHVMYKRRIAFDEALEEISQEEKRVVRGLSPLERSNLESSVHRLGTLHYRLLCIGMLEGFHPVIHGDEGWKTLLDQRFVLKGPLHYYTELPLFYNACKVNFNTTSLQMHEAVNQRVFDVPACAGFLLTDHLEVLHELFDVGKEIVVYEDLEEIPEKVRYYLRHPEQREKIARQGRERVLKEHTYRHRLQKIVQAMRARYG